MLFAADSRFKQRPLKPTLLSLGGGNKALLSHQTDIIGEVCFTFKVCQLVGARFFLNLTNVESFFFLILENLQFMQTNAGDF